MSGELTIIPRRDLETEARGHMAMLELFARADSGRSSLMGKIGNPMDALILADAGHGLGMSPLTALRSFHMIKGTPVLMADRMAALVVANPACAAFGYEVSTEERCVCFCRRYQRDGTISEFRTEWDMKRAAKAGTASNENYKKHPAQMLRARASSEIARMAFPDALAGIMAVEDMEADRGPVVLRPAGPSMLAAETANEVALPFTVDESEPAPLPYDVASPEVWAAYDVAHGKDAGELRKLPEAHARNRAAKLAAILSRINSAEGAPPKRAALLERADRAEADVPTKEIEAMRVRLRIKNPEELGDAALLGYVAALLRPF